MKKLLYLFLLFPFVFFFPSFYVFAEGNNTLGSLFGFYPSDCLSTSGYANSDIYDSGVNTLYFETNSFDVSYLSDLQLPELSGYDYSNYSKVCCVSNSSDTFIILIDSNSYFIKPSDPTKIGVCSLISRGSTPSDNLLILYYSNGVYQSYFTRNYDYLKNNVDYSYAGYLLPYSSYHNALCANTELYGLDVSAIPSSWGSFNGQDYFEIFAAAHSEGFDYPDAEQVNEIYKNCNYIEEDISGSGSGGENASNNMFLNNPKWDFNNIPILDNVYSDDIQKNLGTISFTAELTDYQKEHLNEFSIQFNFDTYLKLRFVNNDGTQTYTNQTFNIHKTVSLSDFYNNGLTDSNLVSNIWDGWYSTGSGNLTLNNYLSSLDQGEMFNPVVFQTQCKATLVHNNDSSGNLTTAYNYLNGASQTSDSGLGINPNPYNNDYDGFFDDQFQNDNGNNVSTNGNNNIVNNNNPNITINNNNNNALTSDGDSNGLLSTLLLMITNNQTATSEGIAEVADTTGFVQVCGDVFTAIPSNWWLVLTAAFVSCIGILVISFAIKIILNIVT